MPTTVNAPVVLSKVKAEIEAAPLLATYTNCSPAEIATQDGWVPVETVASGVVAVKTPVPAPTLYPES